MAPVDDKKEPPVVIIIDTNDAYIISKKDWQEKDTEWQKEWQRWLDLEEAEEWEKWKREHG